MEKVFLQIGVLDSLVNHLKSLSDSAVSQSVWTALARDLQSRGLPKTSTDAIILWANVQREEAAKRGKRLRLLHPMEKEVLSVEAFDHLQELHFLGLLTAQQMEFLIDHAGYQQNIPVSKEQIQKQVAFLVTEQFRHSGLHLSH